MTITVTKVDGSKDVHPGAQAEGISGELFIRGEHGNTIVTYGNGEWAKFDKSEDA